MGTTSSATPPAPGRRPRVTRLALLIAVAGATAAALVALAALTPSPSEPDAGATVTTSPAQADRPLDLSGLVTASNVGFDRCRNDATQLYDCGPAPEFRGVTTWLNSPGGDAVQLAGLRGSVVLVDFFAYTCINCRRAVPHLIAWQQAYADAGLEVVGIHSPQWDFERDPASVQAGISELGITYPVAVDDRLSTFTDYRSRVLPSSYLVDAEGQVRSIQFGEGNYAQTEQLIRDLLVAADPGAELPPPTDLPDETPDGAVITPETLFGWTRAHNFAGPGDYPTGTAEFTFPVSQDDDTFAVDGTADVETQYLEAVDAPVRIRLYYTASEVRMVLAGTGTVQVSVDGEESRVDVSGTPQSYRLTQTEDTRSGVIEVTLPPGVRAYSFTFGGG